MRVCNPVKILLVVDGIHTMLKQQFAWNLQLAMKWILLLPILLADKFLVKLQQRLNHRPLQLLNHLSLIFTVYHFKISG